MQSNTCSKNAFNELVCPEPAFVFYNSHKLGTSNGMLYPHSYPRNFFIELFLFLGKYFSLSFLDRLYNLHLFRCISLMSRVLVQGTRYRKRIHCVCHLLIMRFTANSLANKENQTGCSNYNGILNRMAFLFSAILLFLLVRINRTRNFPLSAVMEQYRFGQTLGKFLVRLCRYKTHCFKRQTKNVGQTVYKYPPSGKAP